MSNDLQVVFELESLFALWTLELAKDGTLVVADHVTLKAVNICELFVAHLARLKQTMTNKYTILVNMVLKTALSKTCGGLR